MKRVALMLGMLALSAPVHAQMYKWVDKEGKTHYTDSPPPHDAKSVTPPPAARTSAAPSKDAAPSKEKPTGKAEGKPAGKPEGTQGSFRPEEEVALRTVCVIHLLESLTCQLELRRSCPLGELVKGIGGDPNKGLARDPRNDPNYEYRVESRSDDAHISAIPKGSGLTGFFSSNSGTRYNPGGAARANDKQIAGGISCPDFK